MNFKPSKVTLALLSSGLMAVTLPAFAEEEKTASTQKDQTAENTAVVGTEIIEIKGIRRSIIGSLDKKRFSDMVSEVIDAGDLNSLPDISIADALGRLPGVTTVRASGQSSQLNIRGMNGDFIQTTLNGREQASTSGYTAGSRWISFDQYPSELISQAAVYKSPKASLIEGGVAATVELKTANPLDAKKDHNFATSMRLSYNDAASDVGADDTGSRLSFSYQGKFLDETLGFGVGVAHMEQPNNTEEVSARKYSRAQDFNGDGVAERAPDGYQIRAAKGTDERLGLMSTLVYQPNDTFKMQFDYFRSEFESEDKMNGLNIDGLNKNNDLYNLTDAEISEGYLVGGNVALTANNGPWIEMRSEDQSTESTTDSFGLKLEWLFDDYEIYIDAAHSKGTKSRVDRIASMHAYEFGTTTLEDGSVVDSWQELSGQSFAFGHNSKDAADINLNTDYTDLSHMRLGDWEQFPHEYSDEIDSIKVDFKYYVDSSFINSIEIGARWSDRTFADKRSTFRWGAREGQDGYQTADGTIVTNQNCEQNQYNHACVPIALDGFVSTKNMNGFSYLDLDLVGIANAAFGEGNYDAQQTWEHNWTLIESGSVREKVLAGYVMANFESEIADIPFTGNFGVRVIKTDTKSRGIQQLQGGETGDGIIDDNGVSRNDYANINYGPEYTDTLPSINLNFQISDNEQIRFAAAKVIGRPPVHQLRGGAGSWADTANDGVSQRYNVWSKGNPNLDPFRATQYDLSYEHFTEGGGAFIAALFWKDIDTLIESVTYNEGEIDWADIGIEAPEGFVEGTYQTTRNNDQGGYIRGVELAYTTVFTQLPGIFSTLGINTNYSYTESETTVDGGGVFDDKELSLPGLSKHVFSATIFWDVDHVSTHLNLRYRDDYIYEGSTPGGTAYQYADEYLVVDWQGTYSFDNGIDAVLQVNNLTDEPNTTNYGTEMATGEYKKFGRQFFLGVNYSF